LDFGRTFIDYFDGNHLQTKEKKQQLTPPLALGCAKLARGFFPAIPPPQTVISHYKTNTTATMSKSILFLLIVIPTFLFGQDLKKIKDKKNNEVFYVLKWDQTVKYGVYKRFSYNNKLLVKGFYQKGVKDGIWECYDFDGQLTLKYNYTNNKLVFHKSDNSDKNKKYTIVNGSTRLDTTLSRPPIFLGGDHLILSELVKNLRYPSMAFENGKSGVVYVVFTVDKLGKTSNHHVETPLGFGMDEEAIRVLKLLPDDWLPGLLGEQPVDVEVVYPVNFKLIDR
jgi:TonB family protein